MKKAVKFTLKQAWALAVFDKVDRCSSLDGFVVTVSVPRSFK